MATPVLCLVERDPSRTPHPWRKGHLIPYLFITTAKREALSGTSFSFARLSDPSALSNIENGS